MNEQEELKEIVELRTQLTLENAIDRHLNEVVRTAGGRVHLLHDDRAMRGSQIRNVLDVAMSTQGLDVVTNFIRYQMGRSGGNQAWLHSNFGQEVVQDIESQDGIIQRLANEVVNEVCRNVPEANPNDVACEARLRLVRLYLGYLNRWFYYGANTRRWNDIKAATKEEERYVR